jgi:hypothetical protein
MRLAIPLFPWAISVCLERRSRQPLRWRFRIRTLLILVVIAALLMGAWMAKQRQQFWKLRETEWKLREREYRDRAASYARAETSHLLDAATGKSSLGAIGDGMGWRVIRMGPREHKRMAAEYGRLKRSYEQATATPWLPLQFPRGAFEEGDRIAKEQGAIPAPEPPSWLPTTFTTARTPTRRKMAVSSELPPRPMP